MSGIVTPEAVRLEFEAAGIGSRALALAIDLMLQTSVMIGAVVSVQFVVDGAGAALPDWVAVTISLLVVFAAYWGYPVALETLWRGRTLGKAAMGLRVVTKEGAPVRFRHAAIRAALSPVDFWITLGGVAVVSALVTREHQRLGDLVAGTLVLRERTGAAAPTAVTFTVPPGTEAYAATIDPSGLTGDDYAAVRGFLLRAGDLPPHVRADLAGRLAAPVAQRLRHRPPQWATPELFLVCVAARFQERGGAGRPAGAGEAARVGSGPGAVPAPPAAAGHGVPPGGVPAPPSESSAGAEPPAGGFAPPG